MYSLGFRGRTKIVVFQSPMPVPEYLVRGARANSAAGLYRGDRGLGGVPE